MCVGALCSDCIVWRLHCVAAVLRGSVVGMTDRQVDSARPAGTQSWQVAGVGHDVVDVPAFAKQLAMPGTGFATRAFAPVELRQCEKRAARARDGAAAVPDPVACEPEPRWRRRVGFRCGREVGVSRDAGVAGCVVGRGGARCFWRGTKNPQSRDTPRKTYLYSGGINGRGGAESLGTGASRSFHTIVRGYSRGRGAPFLRATDETCTVKANRVAQVASRGCRFRRWNRGGAVGAGDDHN